LKEKVKQITKTTLLDGCSTVALSASFAGGMPFPVSSCRLLTSSLSCISVDTCVAAAAAVAASAVVVVGIVTGVVNTDWTRLQRLSSMRLLLDSWRETLPLDDVR
jgi:hypothetical protein